MKYRRDILRTGKIVPALFLVLAVVACDTDDGGGADAMMDVMAPAYVDLDAPAAKALLDGDLTVVIIDVSPLFDAGHIPGSFNAPFGDGTFEALVPSLDKEATYLIYCHGDAPSIGASQALIDAGFTKVYRLQGNYAAWTGAGYDVESAMSEYKDLQPAGAKALIERHRGAIVIDVSPYWDTGHLPGALSHPVGDGSLDAAIPGLDSDQRYLVYCHGDGPSIQGAQKLVDAGFKYVYRLQGNYSAWVAAGYPVETAP